MVKLFYYSIIKNKKTAKAVAIINFSPLKKEI